MALKSKILINDVLKGILLNPNKEINFTTHINIITDDDIEFQYYIGPESKTPRFNRVFKSLSIEYTFNENIFKPIEIFFQSINQKSSYATFSINTSPIINSNINPQQETAMSTLTDSRFKRPVVQITPEYQQQVYHEEAATPWYKNPLNIGIAIVVILIIATFMMKNKKDNSGLGGSLFID